MAKKSRSETLSTTKERIDKCKRWRDSEGIDRTWRRLCDLYKGKHFPNISNTEDVIAVNLAFSTVNVIEPSVAVNYPKITVQANNPQDKDRAVFAEAVINYLWKHHDFRTPYRRAVKDFLIFGHGWVKVGWKFVEQAQTISENERTLMLDQQIAEADKFVMDSPELSLETPSNMEIEANLPETIMKVVEDQPFVERISPFDVYVDPDATCLEDAKWIAQRILRPLESAKKDKRYKPSARKRLSTSYDYDEYYGDYSELDKSQYTDDQVVIWEFYDIMDNTIAIFADNGDEYLVDPIAMPYAYGQPYVMLRNYDVPDSFYPMGDLEAMEGLQLELDKTRTQLMNDRKRYARKYLYHERSFGPEGREALESEEDGRLVPVVDENKPLNEVVIPMPQIPLSPEIYNYSQIIEEDINTVTGLSEYARGAMPEIRRTATEASIVADAQNARSSDKLAIVELGITRVARRVLQLMQQFMTGDQIARINLRNGETLWIPYGREEILGEYDFSVQAGSTQPMNETIRKQQAISLMNAVGPLVGPVIDPTALAMHVLQIGFGISDPERFLVQQSPVPMGPEGAPAGPEGPPMGPPDMMAPPAGGMPPAPMPPTPDDGVFAPTGGIPPEILAQLQNQMGLELPSL
tara:strand:+ start:1518 stop:3422 length:1905 start_codon:yes stop_codon:yes gene_type:complete